MEGNLGREDSSSINPYGPWFYYWKTAAALWEEKIHNLRRGNYLYIPFNWAAHTEDGGNLDLGSKSSETNLAKLFEISLNAGRTPVLFIPIGPAPFLVNGGLPSLLSRGMVKSRDGLCLGLVNPGEKIVRLFSYYDPRIFSSFKSAMDQLVDNFKSKGADIEIYGLRCGYVNEKREEALYLKDYSETFRKGFNKYLKNLGADDASRSTELLLYEYESLIYSLYEETISETLSRYWEGSLNCFFLGGTPNDFFKRIEGVNPSSTEVISFLTHSQSRNSLPMYHLLNASDLTEGLIDYSVDAFDHEYLLNCVDRDEILDFEEDEDQVVFTPLELYDLFYISRDSRNGWEDTGLISFLNNRYPQTFTNYNNLEGLSAQDYFTKRIQFFAGEHFSDDEFKSVLKIFMNGIDIVWDISNLNEEQSRRLELFILENNLNPEEVRFVTDLRYLELGNGKLILINGSELKSLSLKQSINFWDKTLNLLKKPHLTHSGDKDLFFVWKKRAPNTNELNFEEVRKILVYNPTSYKKKLVIEEHAQFKLLRFTEQRNSKVKSVFGNVEMVIQPDGIASADFGFFE